MTLPPPELRANDLGCPTSDDVGVSPEIGGWMAPYDHRGELWFGEVRPRDAAGNLR